MNWAIGEPGRRHGTQERGWRNAHIYYSFADGTAADAGAGFVDGFLDTINPLDRWWSVPDIGVNYGHDGAYAAGNLAGVVGGFAFGMLMGYVGAGGLVGCGSVLSDIARAYNTIDTIAGIASTAQNIMTGNVGWGDLLTFAPIVTQALLPKNCFTAGTEVPSGSVSEDGTRTFSDKKIQDIEIGDMVWAKDEDEPDGDLVLKKVTKLFRHVEFDLQTVTIANADGEVEVLHVTDEHPFFVDGSGWTDAEQLVVGQRVLTSGGTWATIGGNLDEAHTEGIVVYNFEVEGSHTYFVEDGLGENNLWVWVHNACIQHAGEDGAKLAAQAKELSRHLYGFESPRTIAVAKVLDRADNRIRYFVANSSSSELSADVRRVLRDGVEPLEGGRHKWHAEERIAKLLDPRRFKLLGIGVNHRNICDDCRAYLYMLQGLLVE